MNQYYKLLESVISPVDGSYVLKLNGKSLKNGKLKMVPGIREMANKKLGRFFAIYYMIESTKQIFRITSKTKDFKILLTFDVCDKKWEPIQGLLFKSTPSEEKLIKCISAASDPSITRKIISKFKKNKYKTEAMDMDTYGKLMMTISSLVPMLIILITFVSFHIRKQMQYKHQYEAETEAEKDINNSLFKDQTRNEPAFSIYSKLISFIENTLKGSFPAVIICGQSGVGKTYLLRRTFYFNNLIPRKDYTIEKGSSLNLIDVFSLLYAQRKGILVLDDYDTPLQNPDMVNFLKSITDSYKRRIISMPRAKTMNSGQAGSEDYAVPSKFEFQGKLIMITNLHKKDIDKALLTRCPTIEINYSIKEIMDALEKMYKFVSPEVDIKIKKEVLDYIILLYKKNPSLDINFRSYQNCVGARMVDPEGWKQMTKDILGVR